MLTPMMVLIGDLCSPQLDFFFARITFFFSLPSFLSSLLGGLPPRRPANELRPPASFPTSYRRQFDNEFISISRRRFNALPGVPATSPVRSRSVGAPNYCFRKFPQIFGPIAPPTAGRLAAGRMLSPPRFDPVFCPSASVKSSRRLRSHSPSDLHAEMRSIKVQILCYCT